jgi:hypothetical protein
LACEEGNMKTLEDLIEHYYLNLRCFHGENLPLLIRNIRDASSIGKGENILRDYLKAEMSLRVDVSKADYPTRQVLLENIEKLKKLNIGRIPEPPWEVECFLKSNLL